MHVHDAIQLMKDSGSSIADAIPMGAMLPMTFSCSFSAERADRMEVLERWPHCPEDVIQFW